MALTRTEISRRYRQIHPNKGKEWSRKFYASETGKQVSKRGWTKRIVSGKLNEYNRKRYNEDLDYKISQQIRTRLNAALKSENIKKRGRSIALIGCTIFEFKQHIESRFQEDMSWDNWGTVWELDHIKPCAAFDLTQESEQLRCFHYLNQQPLFAIDNRKKADLYDLDLKHEKLLESIKV